MIQDIKIGDKVEVIDDRGHSKSKVGMRLVVSKVELPYSLESLLRFEDSNIEICRFRVEKINDHRHPHADLIHKWAEDTSLVIQSRLNTGCPWAKVNPEWFVNQEYRTKPYKTPAELEKESILSSIKELEENTATALSELQSKLNKLGV